MVSILTPINRKRAVGFIGGGLHSAVGYAHAAACQMDGHWSIESGCFSHKDKDNRETAQHWGVKETRIYLSWEEFLDKEHEKLSAVAVLTPTPDHASIVSAALRAGVPVICEKALATSTAEARVIEDVLKESKGFLAVTYNYSGYPMVRELRNIIASGKLGKVLQMQIEMPQEGFLRTDTHGEPVKPQAWRLKDYAIPTISLDLGVHLHHLVRFLTGETALEVMADQQSYGRHPGVTDDVTCWINYSGGLRVSMWFSKTALGYRNGQRIRVFGEDASAEWYQMNPEELYINYANGKREIIDRGGQSDVANEARYSRFKAGHPAGFIEAFATLYADIGTAIDEWQKTGEYNSEFVPKFSDAYEGLELFEAAGRSASNRRWEPLRSRNESV
jgi:predicted dehydrogenase